MAKLSCCFLRIWRQNKEGKATVKSTKRVDVKVISHESPLTEAEEVEYEGEDEHEEEKPAKPTYNEERFDLRNSIGFSHPSRPEVNHDQEQSDYKVATSNDGNEKATPDIIQAGHLSEPGLKKSDHSWILPRRGGGGGYCSDTLEPDRDKQLSKTCSPGSFSEAESSSLAKGQTLAGFRNKDLGLSPHHHNNQLVGFGFSTESSSLARVNEWVKDLQIHPQDINDNDDQDDVIISPSSPPRTRNYSPEKNTSNGDHFVFRSLNSSSTVVHISSIDLKDIPNISQFSSLRTINLSGNSIAHIGPRTLPKALHTLNLSHNKINAIEGLRELTRLTVLDLSYNRISRIGQGLSNCTMIKELYLARNKISDVEGLHRLMKLTVLDLSFNKITTTKALDHLVANYNSLQALNVSGNPIQSNVSDDQLQKMIWGLLPNLVYLNKQVIKVQRALEGLNNSVAKAALGTSGVSYRRRTVKKVTHGQSESVGGGRQRIRQKAGQKLKAQGQRQLEREKGSSTHVFSSQ